MDGHGLFVFCFDKHKMCKEDVHALLLLLGIIQWAPLEDGRCGLFGDMSGHIWAEMKARCKKVETVEYCMKLLDCGWVYSTSKSAAYI